MANHMYWVGHADGVAADNERDAQEAWENDTGEIGSDYPDLEIEQIPDSQIVWVWYDTMPGDDKWIPDEHEKVPHETGGIRIKAPASAWAKVQEHPGIVFSTEY